MNFIISCSLLIVAATTQKLKRQAGYGQAGSVNYPPGSTGVVSYSSPPGGGSVYPGLVTGNGGVGSIFSASGGLNSYGVYGGNSVIPAQNPNVFTALDQLRGSEALTASEAQSIIGNAYPGTSYPTYAHIPQTSFSCSSVRQFGFYADPETRCQVFRRCEANNYMFSYICPNGTLFNQITLICDWWYNVNCPSSLTWVDYSNPRIYRQDLRLFDDIYGGNNIGSLGTQGYGGGGNTGYGGFSQSASPLYRSAAVARQLLSEPIATGSEKSLREILTQLASMTASTAADFETENLTSKNIPL